MTITSGQHFPKNGSFFEYPYWRDDYRLYPFSRGIKIISQQSIGNAVKKLGKKSLSVGNRSVITHTALAADTIVECYCCTLHNYGTLTVVTNH